jgi:hypothetical protein
MVKIKTLKSSTEFLHNIDLIVKEKRLDYIDAVVYYCEKNNIELETAASVIRNSSYMRYNIQVEAENLNFIPKSAKLPI